MKIKINLSIFIIYMFLLSLLLTGCAGKDKNAIEMTVGDYIYAYSFKGVSSAENGNTVIEMIMDAVKNSNGETADLMTALNVGGMFLMETYIVVDGEEVDYNENSLFAIDSDDNNEMRFVYKYEFDTLEQPATIFFYPSNKRNESDYHWQIDPANGEMIKTASITQD